jgi:hypothetical protein
MPEVVTHRYDPARGACLNVCALPDLEAGRVVERLRRESRPDVEGGLFGTAAGYGRVAGFGGAGGFGAGVWRASGVFLSGRFFLSCGCVSAGFAGDACVEPAGDAMTFTLGDSMSVAAEPGRRVCGRPIGNLSAWNGVLASGSWATWCRR